MESIKIRPATTSDIPIIRQLASTIFPATYKEILTPKQIDYMMDWMYSEKSLINQMVDLNHKYYLPFVNDNPAGYLSIHQEGPDLFHLEKIYVLIDYQHTKLGKALFLHVKEMIHSFHPEPCKMELNVNRNNKALGFYQHMGMKIARQGDFPIGNGYYMNDYIMSIDLE